MEGLPETPEGVALWLLSVILAEVKPPPNRPHASWLLDLYVECLRAARGERSDCGRPLH